MFPSQTLFSSVCTAVMIPLDIFYNYWQSPTFSIYADDPRANDCFCGLSVENKFSLVREQRGILCQYSALQPYYCFGLILMKPKIANVNFAVTE
jgi:hypothetical protein